MPVLAAGFPGAAGQDVAPAGSCWVVAAAAARVTLSQGCGLLIFWGVVLGHWQRLLVWGLPCPTVLGAQGLSVGLLRDLLARAATGGQAGEAVGAMLMGSSAGCSSSSGIPLPRALAEMTSKTESLVCSQLLHPRLRWGDLMGLRCEEGTCPA